MRHTPVTAQMIEEAVDLHQRTPPSKRRPIEELLPDFRFEASVAAHAPIRRGIRGDVISPSRTARDQATNLTHVVPMVVRLQPRPGSRF